MTGVEEAAGWGLTWVGGVLRYNTREEAERARRSAGLGEVVPLGSDGAA